MKINFNFKRFLIGVVASFIIITIGLFIADKFPTGDRFFDGYFAGFFFGCVMYSIKEKDDNE